MWNFFRRDSRIIDRKKSANWKIIFPIICPEPNRNEWAEMKLIYKEDGIDFMFKLIDEVVKLIMVQDLNVDMFIAKGKNIPERNHREFCSEDGKFFKRELIFEKIHDMDKKGIIKFYFYMKYLADINEQNLKPFQEV